MCLKGLRCVDRTCLSDLTDYCSPMQDARCGKCDKVKCMEDYECHNWQCVKGSKTCYNDTVYLAWLIISLVFTFILVSGTTAYIVMKRKR